MKIVDVSVDQVNVTFDAAADVAVVDVEDDVVDLWLMSLCCCHCANKSNRKVPLPRGCGSPARRRRDKIASDEDRRFSPDCPSNIPSSR